MAACCISVTNLVNCCEMITMCKIPCVYRTGILESSRKPLYQHLRCQRKMAAVSMWSEKKSPIKLTN